MKKIKVISEIGSNHNGDIELAKKMIDVSKACGANAVKFQTFKANEVVSKHAPMAKYQEENLNVREAQIDMLKKLELSEAAYEELFNYAKSLEIEMFSTPFDISSVDFLFSQGMKIWKIPSGEITNLPYLEHIAELQIKGKHVILSTGMASLDEVETAAEVLHKGCDKMTIFHCNTNYPSFDEDLNLRAIEQLRNKFPYADIGLSDHSEGIIGAIVGFGFDISMIEKHFTLSKSLPGPDHPMSIEPYELEQLCNAARRAEKMLGRKEKIVTDSEAPNRIWARKSIVARTAIKKGELFTETNLTTKRPGSGVSPMRWHDILGSVAKRDFEADEMIEI